MSLNGIASYDIEVSLYGHKYQRSCFLSSSKISVIWLHSFNKLVLKRYDAIYKRPCQLLAFSVSFILFFLNVKPT